ncbi:hypothetical protein Lesp02_03610 [Lentzea sp. NBRC 105346]|uniref:hypothetical protein n=1 Tax=Lentzea sp. NBRC 105346 TaxID=3032205 RepID=UPI00249FEDF0|nr:hypothetical protein [Lentzea sp. NBRC 105346]GLZ28171.1 hypothetical protein Lesp02_03610 [Lentzea sp. NBRC 105346]
MTSTFAPGTGFADLDDDGTIEAFVAVTGVVDDVGDVIVPGAFTRTLARLRPKRADAHDWRTPIARTLDVRELPPGDRRLPQHTADGGLTQSEIESCKSAITGSISNLCSKGCG